MICPYCLEDRNWFTELYTVTLYIDRNGKHVKGLRCTTCLGWNKKKVKNEK
jgi:hypothetical protein